MSDVLNIVLVFINVYVVEVAAQTTSSLYTIYILIDTFLLLKLIYARIMPYGLA